MLIAFKDNTSPMQNNENIIIMQNNTTNYSLILSRDNLLHIAEQMEDIRENQATKNVKCRIFGNN